MEQRLKHLDLWIWRYLENERNYPGLHLTARPESCAMVLDMLATLRAEGTGRKRTLTLRKLAAADEAKITGGQKYREFDQLHVKLVEPSEDIGFMSASEMWPEVEATIPSHHHGSAQCRRSCQPRIVCR